MELSHFNYPRELFLHLHLVKLVKIMRYDASCSSFNLLNKHFGFSVGYMACK